MLSQPQSQYLDYLIDLNFQRVNRLFALSFESNAVRTGHSGRFLPEVEIEYYNVMIDGENFFCKPIINIIRTYKNMFKKS